jgi:hypothetical protein
MINVIKDLYVSGNIIEVQSADNVHITSSTFNENSVDRNGSVIEIFDVDDINITSSTFSDNTINHNQQYGGQ